MCERAHYVAINGVTLALNYDVNTSAFVSSNVCNLKDALGTLRSPLNFLMCLHRSGKVVKIFFFFFGHVSFCGLFSDVCCRHIMVKTLLLLNAVQISNCCRGAKMSRNKDPRSQFSVSHTIRFFCCL